MEGPSGEFKDSEDWKLKFACHLPFLDLSREEMLGILGSRNKLPRKEISFCKNFFGYLPAELILDIFERTPLYGVINFVVAYPENYASWENYILGRFNCPLEELRYVIESLARGDYHNKKRDGFNKIIFSCGVQEPNIITSIYEKKYPVSIELKLLEVEGSAFISFSKVESSVYSLTEIMSAKLLKTEKTDVEGLVEKLCRKILKNFPEEYTLAFE